METICTFVHRIRAMTAALVRADDLTTYLAEPVGRYYAGRTFLHFFATKTLCGTVLWDRPSEDDIRRFLQIVECELPGRSQRHAALVDARRLTGVDEGAFRAMVDHFGPRAEVYGSNVTRQAIVRPDGALGAVVAGFYQVANAAHPERTKIFTDVAEALAWIGCQPDLIPTIEESQAAAVGCPPAVQALRDYLAIHAGRATLTDAARALAMSSRTLQQHLRQAGTTFRREASASCIRAAERLLAGGDTKLAAIASEVGCASVQHFSTLFRKHHGVTPSEWRRRHRLR